MSPPPDDSGSSLNTWSRTDTLLVGSLLLGTLCVRSLTLRSIDLGGDATFKWFFVRTWQYANAWIFDHHTARFSINLPVYLVQRVFGSHPNGMYVAPLAASVLQAPLLYGCGRCLGSRAIGVVACCATWLFDPAVDAASQLLPGVFQATYVLGALHAILAFARAPESRRRALGSAAVWLFAAYLAMVTSVYVLPGVALGVWLVRRRWLDVALVLGGFLGLIGLETLCYALWTPYPLGQFQLILRTHTDVVPTTFFGLFRRYAVLPRDWQVVLVAWLASALGWLWLRRRPELQVSARGSYAVWLVPASALAGMTFGVKHVNPIIPATDFSIRYCDVLVPLLALGLAASAVWAARWLHRRHSLPTLTPRLMTLAAGLGIALSALAAGALYAPAGAHAFAVTSEQWRVLNEAAARNLPIVANNRSEHLQMKTLTCLQWGYLEDRFLLSSGELRPRKLGRTKLAHRTHRYWPGDSASPEAVRAAIAKQHCLVTVMRRDAEPKLGLAANMGPECEPAPGLGPSSSIAR